MTSLTPKTWGEIQSPTTTNRVGYHRLYSPDIHEHRWKWLLQHRLAALYRGLTLLQAELLRRKEGGNTAPKLAEIATTNYEIGQMESLLGMLCMKKCVQSVTKLICLLTPLKWGSRSELTWCLIPDAQGDGRQDEGSNFHDCQAAFWWHGELFQSAEHRNFLCSTLYKI